MAVDLRQEIYTRVKKGESNQQIIDYLVARYGDFVLYRPPFQWNTYLLWLGPFLLLMIACIVFFINVRKHRTAIPEEALSNQDENRLTALISDSQEEK